MSSVFNIVKNGYFFLLFFALFILLHHLALKKKKVMGSSGGSFSVVSSNNIVFFFLPKVELPHHLFLVLYDVSSLTDAFPFADINNTARPGIELDSLSEEEIGIEILRMWVRPCLQQMLMHLNWRLDPKDIEKSELPHLPLLVVHSFLSIFFISKCLKIQMMTKSASPTTTFDHQIHFDYIIFIICCLLPQR